MLVVIIVVVVIKCHDSPFERLIDIVAIFLDHAFFKKLSCLDGRRAVKLLVIWNLNNSRIVYFQEFAIVAGDRLKIWVFRTLIRLVSNFLATAAFLVQHLKLLFFSHIIVFEVVSCQMFPELTPESILLSFTAAPPQFTRKLGFVHSATPIKVLSVNKILTAKFTNLKIDHCLKPFRF